MVPDQPVGSQVGVHHVHHMQGHGQHGQEATYVKRTNSFFYTVILDGTCLLDVCRQMGGPYKPPNHQGCQCHLLCLLYVQRGGALEQ